MWNSIREHVKLAVCDGGDRKDKRRKTSKLQRQVTFGSASPQESLAKTVQDCADDIVKSIPVESLAKRTADVMDVVRDGTESVKSVVGSFWWEQAESDDSSQRKMKETITVSNDVAVFLLGANADCEDNDRQTVMKTIEDACDVKMRLDLAVERQLDVGMRMDIRRLIIIGTPDARAKAKSRVVKLGVCCQEDTLTNMMDAWEDMSSPWFASSYLQKESPRTALHTTPLAKMSPLVDETSTSRRSHLYSLQKIRQRETDYVWREDMARLTRWRSTESEAPHAFATPCADDKAPRKRMEEVEVEEASPDEIVRHMSKYSNEGKFHNKLDSFMARCNKQLH
jgi:hypothetical protein